MRQHRLALAILLGLAAGGIPALLTAGQVRSERRPTVSEIVRVLGDDAAAGGMVARAIAATLRIKSPTTAFVLAEQIRPEWLPLSTGVQYVMLDREQAATHTQNCGEFLYVQSVTRESTKASVSIGQGNRCSSSGVTKSFQVGVSGWDDEPGIGGGFGGATGHCECR